MDAVNVVVLRPLAWTRRLEVYVDKTFVGVVDPVTRPTYPLTKLGFPPDLIWPTAGTAGRRNRQQTS